MAKMNDKTKYLLDAAPSITFRDAADAALAASANTDAIVLDKVGGYWNTNGELADSTVAIVVQVDEIDTTTGDEAYDIALEAGPVGFATSVKPQTLDVTETGQYVFLVDFDTLKKLKSDVAALRLAVTVAGTTPSIKFRAWIAGRIIL